MWQATRKAAELIKLVTYCNNVNAYCANQSGTHSGGFKAESLLGHITRKASSPLPSPPSSSLLLPTFSVPSPPLEVGPSNPARGSEGAL